MSSNEDAAGVEPARTPSSTKIALMLAPADLERLTAILMGAGETEHDVAEALRLVEAIRCATARRSRSVAERAEGIRDLARGFGMKQHREGAALVTPTGATTLELIAAETDKAWQQFDDALTGLAADLEALA